jgi:hypothetical protein
MRHRSCAAPDLQLASPLPPGARRQDPELRRRLTALQPAIDIPKGWRDEYRHRAFLPPVAFIRGFQILAWHVVPDGYVTVLRKVAAGPFAVLNPGGMQPQISDLQAQQWWAPDAVEHVPPPVPFPNLPFGWRLHLVRSTAVPSIDTQPPVPGVIQPVPFNVGPLTLAGDVDNLWPILECNVDTLFPHVAVVGPAILSLFCEWQQPPPVPSPLALGWCFAESWGILEGVDLRYDDPDVRRILLGGLG